MNIYGINVKELRIFIFFVCFCQDFVMNGNQKIMELRDKLFEFLIIVYSEVLIKVDRRCKSFWFFDINFVSIYLLLDNLDYYG